MLFFKLIHSQDKTKTKGYLKCIFVFGSVVALYFYAILVIFLKNSDDQRKFSHLEKYI